jgi:hypothetical protein
MDTRVAVSMVLDGNTARKTQSDSLPPRTIWAMTKRQCKQHQIKDPLTVLRPHMGPYGLSRRASCLHTFKPFFSFDFETSAVYN